MPTALPLLPYLASSWVLAAGALLSCTEGDGGAPGPASAGEPPALRCSEPRVDLGTAWEGAVLEHEFVFEAPDEGLRVESVRADCGCTLARLEVAGPAGGEGRRSYREGEPVPAGGRLFVQVRYDTRGKRGAAPRAISVYGSFPGGRAELAVSAEVRPWLLSEPDRLELGRVSEKDVLERRLAVTTPTGRPFLLTHDRRGVPDSVALELVPLDPGEDGRATSWSVLARFGPGLPRGAHGYPLYLVSDVENPDAASDGASRHHGVSPMATVQVTGPVSLSPPMLAFGLVRPGETVARTFRVLGHDDHELAEPAVRLEPIRGGTRPAADSEDPGSPLAAAAEISARPVPGENAWDVQVLFEGIGEELSGTVLARVVVETGHPGEAALEIPMTLQVPPR